MWYVYLLHPNLSQNYLTLLLYIPFIKQSHAIIMIKTVKNMLYAMSHLFFSVVHFIEETTELREVRNPVQSHSLYFLSIFLFLSPMGHSHHISQTVHPYAKTALNSFAYCKDLFRSPVVLNVLNFWLIIFSCEDIFVLYY